VVLCKNKLDGRHYAVKKIRLKDKDLHVNEKILRCEFLFYFEKILYNINIALFVFFLIPVFN